MFSALGFYPVTPAVGEYAIGSPLFDRVDLTMPNGKMLTIEDVPALQAFAGFDPNYLHLERRTERPRSFGSAA